MKKLIARGERAASAFIAAMGTYYSIAEAAAILRLGSPAIRRKMAANELLWFKDRATNTKWLPKIQFDRRRVSEWVPDVIAAVGNGRGAIVFLARGRQSTGGKSYVQLLSLNDPSAASLIRRRAQQLAW